MIPGEQIHIYDNDEIVLPPGFDSIFKLGHQVIIATAGASAEATKRSQQLLDEHGKTIKRPIEKLIPEMLMSMFAENWRPPEKQ